MRRLRLLRAVSISGALLLSSDWLLALASSGERPGGPLLVSPPIGPRMRSDIPDHFVDLSQPPLLSGIDITEAQQDKIFEILHAASPALRNKWKALRKAREFLRELSHSAQPNSTRAAAVVEACAEASRQLELVQLQVDDDVFAVLTSEQQGKLLELKRYLDEAPQHYWGEPGEISGLASPR